MADVEDLLPDLSVSETVTSARVKAMSPHGHCSSPFYAEKQAKMEKEGEHVPAVRCKDRGTSVCTGGMSLNTLS